MTTPNPPDTTNLIHDLTRLAGEPHFHAILDAIPVAIYLLTPDHRYLFVNRTFEQENGITNAAIRGLSVYDRFSPEVADALAANERQVLACRTPVEFEESAPHGDHMHYYTSVKAPLLNAAGEPYALLGVSIDVTERKRHELNQQFLGELALHLRLLGDGDQILDHLVRSVGQHLRVAHCRLNEIDLDGRQFTVRKNWAVDPAAPDIPGGPHPLAELAPPALLHDLEAGRTVVVNDITADPRTAPVADQYRALQTVAFVGVPIFHAGRWWATLSVRHNGPRRWQPHEITLLETVSNQLRDLLDRVHAEEALRHLNATLEQRVAARTAELELTNRELDQFIYIASHDLKSPLRGIDLLAGWIAEDAGDQLPPSAQAHLRKLKGRIRRMERLLEDLLTYSRIGRRTWPSHEVDTGDLIRVIVDDLSLPAGFQVILAPGLPTLSTPRPPLELVLRNLIDNAAKHHHNPTQGRVTIQAQPLGDSIEFTVADDGPGIEPQFHERIFGAFQTLRPRDELEGSGMGLAIARRVMEHCGGSLRVESAPGQGATFSFTWPRTVRSN